MTNTYKTVSYGFNEEEKEWFAYAGVRRTTAFARSTVSLEDAFLKLSNVLANKLEKIDQAIHVNIDHMA